MKNKKYEVFISQVNQTRVEVKASSTDEARSKALKKWKKELYCYIVEMNCLEEEDTKKQMDADIKFTACDPDGHKFGYAERPRLGFNELKIETWLCVGNSKAVYLGQEPVTDFKKSLVEL